MNQTTPTISTEVVGFAPLDESGCLGLLGFEDVGRLGLSSGALPVVMPVRYRLIGRSAVFATEAGAKLTSARRGAVACLEIDGRDPSTGTTWTVLATGRLRVVADATVTSSAADLPLRAWGLPSAEHFLALDIALLSGSTSKAE